MAKHGKHFYLELSRKIFTDEYKSLSTEAKWLYVVLNELEHRLTKGGEDEFYQSDNDLSEVSGVKLTTLKKAKKELAEKGLIETRQAHVIKDGKQSRQSFTHYRVK